MKIIDLSGEYTEKMWYYGEPYTPYSVKDLACVDKNGYIAREYTLTAHTGTHIVLRKQRDNSEKTKSSRC